MSRGTASLTPLSVARGYAVFANGGSRVDTWLIDQVNDRDGNLVFKENPALACRECAGSSDQPVNQVVDGFNFGAPAPKPYRPTRMPAPPRARSTPAPPTSWCR
ncbi:hypothetical protein G6F63_016480 [Rhizopus arrhizus]|nr:hypothetical protein G6F63_016480 [Rhizopus arrhizus]